MLTSLSWPPGDKGSGRTGGDCHGGSGPRLGLVVAGFFDRQRPRPDHCAKRGTWSGGRARGLGDFTR